MFLGPIFSGQQIPIDFQTQTPPPPPPPPPPAILLGVKVEGVKFGNWLSVRQMVRNFYIEENVFASFLLLFIAVYCGIC